MSSLQMNQVRHLRGLRGLGDAGDTYADAVIERTLTQDDSDFNARLAQVQASGGGGSGDSFYDRLQSVQSGSSDSGSFYETLQSVRRESAGSGVIAAGSASAGVAAGSAGGYAATGGYPVRGLPNAGTMAAPAPGQTAAGTVAAQQQRAAEQAVTINMPAMAPRGERISPLSVSWSAGFSPYGAPVQTRSSQAGLVLGVVGAVAIVGLAIYAFRR